MITHKEEVFKLKENILYSDKFGYDVDVYFTTNIGGVSKGQYQSNNFSYTVGDDNKDVYLNRKNFAQSINVDLNDFVFISQTHSTNIYKVSNSDKGKGTTDVKKAIEDVVFMRIVCLYISMIHALT